MDLYAAFQKINETHFDAFLDPPKMKWNSRLRSSAGRFIPGSRKYWREYAPVIEVATYLRSEERSEELINDTIAHEMIHYWLWVRRKPYGHTDEFISKMKEMGVSRYNPVPRLRPFRYVYVCIGCTKEFFVKRRLGTLACARCCKEHSSGKFDRRFLLILQRTLDPAEGLELVNQRFRSAAPTVNL